MLAPMLHAKCRRAAPRAAAAALRGSSSMVHELGQRLKKLYEAKPVEPQEGRPRIGFAASVDVDCPYVFVVCFGVV